MLSPDFELMQRIQMNPEIAHGKPCIRNTRLSVTHILDLLSSGMTNTEIISDYPELQEEDIRACLAFASILADRKAIYPYTP